MKGTMIGIGIAGATVLAFVSGLIGFIAGVALVSWVQDRTTSYSGRMRYQSFRSTRPRPETPSPMTEQ